MTMYSNLKFLYRSFSFHISICMISWTIISDCKRSWQVSNYDRNLIKIILWFLVQLILHLHACTAHAIISSFCPSSLFHLNFGDLYWSFYFRFCGTCCKIAETRQNRIFDVCSTGNYNAENDHEQRMEKEKEKVKKNCKFDHPQNSYTEQNQTRFNCSTLLPVQLHVLKKSSESAAAAAWIEA